MNFAWRRCGPFRWTRQRKRGSWPSTRNKSPKKVYGKSSCGRRPPRILTIHGGIGGIIPVYATVPVTAHLAKDGKRRDWINAYVPTERPELTAGFESSSRNILWTADVWRRVKKYGCLEAQALIRAKRAMLGDH